MSSASAITKALYRVRLSLSHRNSRFFGLPRRTDSCSAAVRPGNLVNAGSTLLTTLVSIDPVYVEFEGDERMYLK